MTNGVDERTDEYGLQWFGYFERIERVYVGECVGSRSASRPRKRMIDTVKVCLRKRRWDVRQPRRMVQGRSEYQGVYEGEDMERSPRNEP